MDQVRVTFSLPAEGELSGRLFEYSRFERSFIIKEALNAYFGIGTRVPAVTGSPVAPRHEQPAAKAAEPVEELRAADFMGDFADD